MTRLTIHLLAGLVFPALMIGSCNSSAHPPVAGYNEYSLDKHGETDKRNTTIKLLDATTFNFGNIEAGDTVIHKFLFTNTGSQPLIIASADATCGCTVAYFNKQPIGAGKTDSIVATFISSKKMVGFQSKVVTVKCNSSASPFLLTMYGRVK